MDSTSDDGCALAHTSQWYKAQVDHLFLRKRDLECNCCAGKECNGWPLDFNILSDVISVEIYDYSNVCIGCLYNIFDIVGDCNYLHTFTVYLYSAAIDVPLGYIEWLADKSTSLRTIECKVDEYKTPERLEWVAVVEEIYEINIDIWWPSMPRPR